MGYINEYGTFVPPLSYMEAQQLPKREIEMFITLDDLAAKKIRSLAKKNKSKGTVK